MMLCDHTRELFIAPVTLHTPVQGSYNSALFKETPPVQPPLTNTVPLPNNDAVWLMPGNYSSRQWPSTLPSKDHTTPHYSKKHHYSPDPPLTNTVPLPNNDAVCSARELFIAPVVDQAKMNRSLGSPDAVSSWRDGVWYKILTRTSYENTAPLHR